MIQPQTQTTAYWGPTFALTDSDIEQLINHFLEVEQPLTLNELARVIIGHRLNEEKKQIKRNMANRSLYHPHSHYNVGELLVFPALQFVSGQVIDAREGKNPQIGKFSVIKVELNGKEREFAADYPLDHPLNRDNGSIFEMLEMISAEEIYKLYGPIVVQHLATALPGRDNFVRLGQVWFLKDLMLDINIGHLHLAEAVLEVSDGGPLTTEEIMVHLDLANDSHTSVRTFSLNHALFYDGRFDEVAPKGKIAWFLRRMEPEGVQTTPERLKYTPIPYDRTLLNAQLLVLERELDDEWSDLERSNTPQPVVFTLTYPHRWAGTIPLTSRIAPLFPLGISPRQRFLLIDEATSEEIVVWAVQGGRYIHGLAEWYQANAIPVGGFLTLRPGPAGAIYLNFDRRRGQKEWVRLASVGDGRVKFDISRRTIGCGYDELMLVGTDYIAAVDVLWRRAESQQRPVASLLAEIFPELITNASQRAVHAKTLYSAIQILRRMPPGPLFAELVNNPLFQSVGDYYWQFDPSRQRGH